MTNQMTFFYPYYKRHKNIYYMQCTTDHGTNNSSTECDLWTMSRCLLSFLRSRLHNNILYVTYIIKSRVIEYYGY